MRKLSMGKKGTVGLGTSKKVMLAMFTLAILGFALVIALNQLNSSSVSTTQTTSIVNNVTGGVEAFFGNATTWFALLAIVVLILIIMIVLRSVNSGTGKGGL